MQFKPGLWSAGGGFNIDQAQSVHIMDGSSLAIADTLMKAL
jgi:hypothetical protein